MHGNIFAAKIQVAFGCHAHYVYVTHHGNSLHDKNHLLQEVVVNGHSFRVVVVRTLFHGIARIVILAPHMELLINDKTREEQWAMAGLFDTIFNLIGALTDTFQDLCLNYHQAMVHHDYDRRDCTTMMGIRSIIRAELRLNKIFTTALLPALQQRYMEDKMQMTPGEVDLIAGHLDLSPARHIGDVFENSYESPAVVKLFTPTNKNVVIRTAVPLQESVPLHCKECKSKDSIMYDHGAFQTTLSFGMDDIQYEEGLAVHYITDDGSKLEIESDNSLKGYEYFQF